MIQRIQSVYLFITSALLLFATLSENWFTFINDSKIAVFNATGVDVLDVKTNTIQEHTSYPFYIITVLLFVLSLATLFSYKKIKIQLKIGRLNFVLYLLAIIGLTVIAMAGNSLVSGEFGSRELGLGYFALLIGFPLVFMANLGIKRDKKLVDSLNRIR